ncbi:hypothetical protein JHL18_11805 [Clostridium sp. YIM B02505]|uniref:Carrier domain-containing protein n=1 Tax=Clostridium yunnanense TaxID=2800325 RepID=A0ABS1EPI2_9CLOT|nr:phosphopantetheine-binding protein [Clostridium yunnanense]MBK1811311.1 hypothetical protein [Clostridium yunnanense]
MFEMEKSNEIFIGVLRNLRQCDMTDDELLNCENLNNVGFDSVDLMHLAVACEDAFGISIDDEYLTYDILNSCQELIKVVKMKINKK